MDNEAPREPWAGRTSVVLEAGGWWEVLPSDLDHFMAHAREYVKSPTQDPEAKARVRRVWLEHKYAPAWQKFTPRQKPEPEDPF